MRLLKTENIQTKKKNCSIIFLLFFRQLSYGVLTQEAEVQQEIAVFLVLNCQLPAGSGPKE